MAIRLHAHTAGPLEASIEEAPQADLAGEAPKRPKASRFRFWSSVGLLASLHIALTHYFLPLPRIFSDSPLTGDDYDLHIGQVFKVVEGLERWGHSWIYDVRLLAGQPEGTVTDSSSKGWELWTYLLHVLNVPAAVGFNTFVLLTMLAGPVLAYIGTRLFGFDHWCSLFAAIMTTCLWFFDSNVHWMWFIGMVPWALASSWSIVTLGLIYRYFQWPTVRWGMTGAVSLGINLLIHPYAFFVLGVPIAAMYARNFKKLRLSAHLGVLGIAATPLAINGYWLLSAYRHWQYILDSAYFAQADPIYLLCDWAQLLCGPSDTGLIGTRTGFRYLVLLLGFVGLIALRARRDQRFLPLVTTLIVLYGWAYLGGLIPAMQQTQPYRHIVPATLASAVPAAVGIEWLLCEVTVHQLSRKAQVTVFVLAMSLAQHLFSQVLYFVPKLVPEPRRLHDGSISHISKYGFLHGPLVMDVHYGVPRDASLEMGVEETLNWLAVNAAPRSRVLIEGTAIGERLAWRYDFEVFGGFVERNLSHSYANFFRTYGKRTATTQEVSEYLQLYAVDWVVGLRPEFARDVSLLEHVALVGGRNIYKTRLPVNRVLSGGGIVEAETNRLIVRQSDPRWPVILSYHWHEAFRCTPGCQLERSWIGPDRVGLLRVPAPHPATFTIWNSYSGF